MARLFFDCPIKAAYMAKEFGVEICLDIPKYAGKSISSIEYKIEIPNLGINKFVPKILPKTDGSNEYETNWEDTGKQDYLSFPRSNEKFYVAPESEAIFEPKEEDITIHKNGISAGYFSKEYGNWCRINARKLEIIMRDGKQFFAANREGKE